MGLGRWYKRWRHGRGFGVHSPSAYGMVMEALRPWRGYAYRAELAACPGSGVLPAKRARQLVRMAAYADVRSADVTHICDASLRAAVTAVMEAYSPGIPFKDGGADIAFADGGDIPALPDCQGDKLRLLVLLAAGEAPRRALREALSAAFGAITIDNARDLAVTMLRHDLPRQRIEAAF